MPIKMKVCNTADYNESLRKRGNIFYLFEEATRVWLYNTVEKKERSKFVYSNQLIQTLAVFRYVLKYSFRQLQGLLQDYVNHMKLELPVPDFTTLCRRIAKLTLTIKDHRTPKQVQTQEPVDVVIDSTGINIYHTDGGHSKKNSSIRKHSRYDQVRKMHAAIDPKSKNALSIEMSNGTTTDATMAPILLSNIPFPIGSVWADGAYDRIQVRKICAERNAKQIIPPYRNARIKQSKKIDPPNLWNDRNAAIKLIRSSNDLEEGRKIWKQTHDYGKRSIVEAFFSRFKAIFSFHFMSRNEKSRYNELMIKARILNTFNQYGAAVFQKVNNEPFKWPRVRGIPV